MELFVNVLPLVLLEVTTEYTVRKPEVCREAVCGNMIRGKDEVNHGTHGSQAGGLLSASGFALA